MVVRFTSIFTTEILSSIPALDKVYVIQLYVESLLTTYDRTMGFSVNKREIKPKGQSRMDNLDPEPLTTLSIQYIGRRQTKQKQTEKSK
jgi:hypothetical protein